jgi:hypothetical protein
MHSPAARPATAGDTTHRAAPRHIPSRTCRAASLQGARCGRSLRGVGDEA